MVTRLRRGALATYLEEGDGGERLSAADASNIYIDAVDQVNVFLLAGVLGPGGFVPDRGEPELDHLRADLATRLADDVALRRFSQRPGRPGHGGGGGRGGRRSGRALAWLPSPPDLTWHVRTAQPVAGREGLAALCAHLMTVPLPTDRPRWELLVVPGASPEGPGIVLRCITPSRTGPWGWVWCSGCSVTRSARAGHQWGQAAVHRPGRFRAGRPPGARGGGRWAPGSGG